MEGLQVKLFDGVDDDGELVLTEDGTRLLDAIENRVDKATTHLIDKIEEAESSVATLTRLSRTRLCSSP